MKALKKLTVIEKGKVLAEIFPDHLPHIIRFIELQVKRMEDNDQDPLSQWVLLFDNADFWSDLAKKIRSIIALDGDRLAKKPKLFASRLFSNPNSLMTNYCLLLYVESGVCDPNVARAINLLFGKGAAKENQ